MRKLVGSGVFGWCATDRRSQRYGAILLSDSPYNGGPVAEVMRNSKALKKLNGRRVRIVCRVIKTRNSGHAGDRILGIFPQRPKKGQEIDLGVGMLVVEKAYDGTDAIALKPNDGREKLWIDPRKLYTLHDQTVEVYLEETSDPFSPAPDIAITETGPVAVDNGDGTYQVANVDPNVEYRVTPHARFASLGSGMSSIEFRGGAGVRLDISKVGGR